MAWFFNGKMTSKAQSGTTVYPVASYRKYLMIVAGAGGVTVALDDGDAFSIPEGSGWEPSVCPTSQLTIVGACVVVTDSVQV
jgi:uncharacterized protein YjlB